MADRHRLVSHPWIYTMHLTGLIHWNLNGRELKPTIIDWRIASDYYYYYTDKGGGWWAFGAQPAPWISEIYGFKGFQATTVAEQFFYFSEHLFTFLNIFLLFWTSFYFSEHLLQVDKLISLWFVGHTATFLQLLLELPF